MKIQMNWAFCDKKTPTDYLDLSKHLWKQRHKKFEFSDGTAPQKCLSVSLTKLDNEVYQFWTVSIYTSNFNTKIRICFKFYDWTAQIMTQQLTSINKEKRNEKSRVKILVKFLMKKNENRNQKVFNTNFTQILIWHSKCVGKRNG